MWNLALVALSVVLGATLSLWAPWYRVALIGVPALLVAITIHMAWQSRVRSQPRLSVILSVASYILVVLLVGLTTYAAVFAGALIPAWVARSGSALSDTVAGVVTGSITALVGVVWLDNAKSAEGTLWPENGYRLALRRAFTGAAKLNHPRSEPMERLYQAAFDDTTEAGDISGWRLVARWRRARVVRSFDR